MKHVQIDSLMLSEHTASRTHKFGTRVLRIDLKDLRAADLALSEAVLLRDTLVAFIDGRPW